MYHNTIIKEVKKTNQNKDKYKNGLVRKQLVQLALRTKQGIKWEIGFSFTVIQFVDKMVALLVSTWITLIYHSN